MKITKEMRERKKIIKKLGLRVNDITKTGKHPKLHVTDGRKTIKYTVPATTSCRKSLLNMQSDLKRMFAL